MPNTIRIKRSAVSGKIPTTGDLQLGEFAVNTFDGKLYTLRNNGTPSVVEIGAVPAANEATAGIAEVATQAETNSGTDDSRIVTPLKLTNWIGKVRKFDVGDGTSTSYTLTHNLNTRDVIVRVFPNSGEYDDVELDVRRPSVNTVTLVFSLAPSLNSYRAVVMA